MAAMSIARLRAAEKSAIRPCASLHRGERLDSRPKIRCDAGRSIGGAGIENADRGESRAKTSQRGRWREGAASLRRER